jgi:hypothetical protein
MIRTDVTAAFSGGEIKFEAWRTAFSSSENFNLRKTDTKSPACAECFHRGFFSSPAHSETLCGVACRQTIRLFVVGIDLG